jgi:hypothetical protein
VRRFNGSDFIFEAGHELVPETNADPPHAFHATNACGQFWTQEASVGRLVRHAANRSEPKVDRGRRIPALFEVNPTGARQSG